MTAGRIYHIADRLQWEEAVTAGAYRCSTLGLDLDEVGFIHCSFAGQVDGVAHRFYSDHPSPLVVLEIDQTAPGRVGVEVRAEDGGAGELFPHIYGPIDPAWVLQVYPAGFGADGQFAWGDLGSPHA